MRTRCVYRLYNAAGDLLYIGSTKDLHQRLNSHRVRKAWWPEIYTLESEPFPYDVSYQVEHDLIRSAPGRYNTLPAEIGRRAVESRLSKQRAAHEAVRPCQVCNCSLCIERFPYPRNYRVAS